MSDANIITGTIDGQKVERLNLYTNGFGFTMIQDAGEYVNQIKFYYDSSAGGYLGMPIGGRFMKWNGSKWVNVSPDTAAKLFRNRDQQKDNKTCEP